MFKPKPITPTVIGPLVHQAGSQQLMFKQPHLSSYQNYENGPQAGSYDPTAESHSRIVIGHRNLSEAEGDTGRAHLLPFPSKRLVCDLTGWWKYNNIQAELWRRRQEQGLGKLSHPQLHRTPHTLHHNGDSSHPDLFSGVESSKTPATKKNGEKSNQAKCLRGGEVKDRSTRFIIISWEQEHKIIKATPWDMPGKCLAVIASVTKYVTEAHGGDGGWHSMIKTHHFSMFLSSKSFARSFTGTATGDAQSYLF